MWDHNCEFVVGCALCLVPARDLSALPQCLLAVAALGCLPQHPNFAYRQAGTQLAIFIISLVAVRADHGYDVCAPKAELLYAPAGWCGDIFDPSTH